MPSVLQSDAPKTWCCFAAKRSLCVCVCVCHVQFKAGTWRVGGLLALSRAFGDAYLKVKRALLQCCVIDNDRVGCLELLPLEYCLGPTMHDEGMFGGLGR